MAMSQQVLIMDDVVTPHEAAEHHKTMSLREYKPEYDDEEGFASGRSSGSTSELSDDDEVVKVLMARVQRMYPIDDFMVYRSYVNSFVAGEHPVPHRDRLPPGHPLPHVMTLLYYVTSSWNYMDGGETVFYRDDKSWEVIKSVRPKEGRAIIFFGDIYHCARPPLANYRDQRLTLAIKFTVTPSEKEL